MTAALDTFLDGAQRGTPDLLDILGVWVEDADPAAARLLTAGLASRQNPVAAATYDLDIQVEDGQATLVAAFVRVKRADGSSASVELAFDVADEAPRLMAIGSRGAP